jgi:sporulation protein YlmC with PRC-barrel domain
MSDLTLGTPVTGSDEPIGRLTGLVCHPTTREITHLVVNADDVPGSERLVPIDRVADSRGDHLTLAMSRHHFFQLKTLETIQPLSGDAPDEAEPPLPFPLADHAMTFAPHERIPGSELVVRRGTKVVDRRGHRLGRIHAFVVDPASHAVTHLTLQKGHLFGHRDMTIAITDIARVTEDAIRLRIDSDAVAGHAVAHGPGRR